MMTSAEMAVKMMAKNLNLKDTYVISAKGSMPKEQKLHR
jgi:hypothetical protein